MTPFAAIIPDRRDRKPLTDFCLAQLSRMTVKPDMVYLVDRPALNGSKDIVWRVKLGIEEARKDGIDNVYIIENDDYYPPDYFEKMVFDDAHFVGCTETIYYHIFQSCHEHFRHPGRSSLCFTGFKISALDLFHWPSDDTTFLDVRLWNFTRRNHKIKTKFYNGSAGVGIKHNIGLLGGSGHTRKLKNHDPNMEYLRSLVDETAFQFYERLRH